MKIRTERRQLADALTWVVAAIDKRPVSPALGGVRLVVADERLTLSGTNFETSHTATLEVEAADDGECLVSGLFLREVVGAMKDREVELVLDGPRLLVNAGRSAYRVATLPVEEHPTMPALPEVNGTLDAEDLVAMIGAVEHAATRDPVVPVLTAVHLTADGDQLTASTTDKYRIARAVTDWAPHWPAGELLDVIVPASSVAAAVKGMTGTVRVGVKDGLFGIADDRRAVTLRTFDDDFPKVDNFLDGPGAVELEVDARDLAEAVKRAAMIGDDHDAVTLAVTGSEVEVTATSETSDGAEVVGCTSDGEHGATFNGRYLVDALTATDSTRARIRFSGPAGTTKPIYIKPLDHPHVDLTVMPRRQK